MKIHKLIKKLKKSLKKRNSKIIIKPIEEEYLEHKKFLKEEMKKNFFNLFFYIISQNQLFHQYLFF